MANMQKVAVIGAGVAGLSCATALKQAGFNVTIFEKSRGASGRLSTRVTENLQCDHGAQYFTARNQLFNAEVQRWVKAEVAQLWQPVLQVFDGQTFTPKPSEETQRYVGYPKNNAPAKWLASQLNVTYEATVCHVNKHENGWQISTKEHGLHTQNFDFIVLAIPAPQAAELLAHTHSGLTSLCADVTMQPCFALMVQLNDVIDCQFDGLFINTGPLTWIARDTAKPGRPQFKDTHLETWVLHVSSQWSATHVNQDKALVTEQMLAEFTKILQTAKSTSAPIVIENLIKSTTLHRWLYADCPAYLTQVYAFDAKEKIGLCGDWLNGGKVQGAWLSGLTLANHLIQTN